MNSNNTQAIYAQMQIILTALQPVAKTEQNQQTRSTYRGYEQLQNALSPILRDAGIFLQTEILEREQEEVPRPNKSSGRYCRIRIRLTFISLQDGSSISTESVAGASDYGDFAETQALTYATKNALQHALCIPTEKNEAYEKRKQYLRKEMETQALESGDKKPEEIADNTPEEAQAQPAMKWATISKCSIPYKTDDERIMLIQGKSKTLFIRLTDQQLADKQAASA